MADEIESLVLENLKHIRRKLDTIEEKVDMLTQRVSSLEQC
jgi:hypothetical protein